MLKAPECFTERSFTAKSDVWAIGVLLYELFVGVRDEDLPFYGSFDEMHDMAQRGALVPKPLPAECPEAVRNMAAACLATDPARRPTALELLKLVHEWRCELHEEGHGADDALPADGMAPPLKPLEI